MENKYLENKTLNSGPLISIVIINYNGIKYLPELFKSLSEQTYKNFELIIWDNNSSDGSQQWLREQKIIKKCLNIFNKSNVGFGKANNRCIKHTSGELICLLNNDTIVDKNWLSYLRGGIIHNRADIVGPKILFEYPYINITIQCTKSFETHSLPFILVNKKCSTFINNQDPNKRLTRQRNYKLYNGDILQLPIPNSPSNSLQIHWPKLHEKITLLFNKNCLVKTEDYWKLNSNKINERKRHIINSVGLNINIRTGKAVDHKIFTYDNEKSESSNKVRALSGCCFMIKKSIIDEFGFFDEQYFMYYEDVEFFFRINKLLKLKILTIQKSIVYHKNHGLTSIKKTSLINRHHLLFISQHYHFATFLWYKLLYFYSDIIKFSSESPKFS